MKSYVLGAMAIMTGMSLSAQTIIDTDFESGKGDWGSRGGETVSISSEAANSGKQSLKVSSRSSYWNGARCSSSQFEAGKSYDVEAYVYFDGTTFNPSSEATTTAVPFKSAYPEDTYFKVGTCVSGYGINDAALQNMIKTHFNSVTPENELKPDAVLDQNASKQYGNNVNPQVRLGDGAKQILSFCEKNGIGLRGHCFVWHSQTPTWLFKENFNSSGNNVSKEIMEQRLENYIKNVINLVTKSYPNLNIYAWDVVNEAFNGDGTLRSAGDNSVSPGTSYWMQIYGSDEYIQKAFLYARKYAPKGCKLYYNDYNEYDTAKRDAIANLVSKMYKDGTCDGVGMQSHLDTGYPSATQYEAAVKKFTDIGCDVQITELDITNTDDNALTKSYDAVFNIYKKYKDKISAVVVWGINDSKSWRSSKKPLLFDSSNNPKQCYYKIITGMTPSTTASSSVEELKSNTFSLCFQYKDGDDTKYPTIKSVEVPSKTWTKLAGVMEVPADATDISIYVQTSDTDNSSDLIDFYVDDVKCSLVSSTSLMDNDASQYELSQNLPNPATGETSFQFSVKDPGQVVISLYALNGNKIADIVNGYFQSGTYMETFAVDALSAGVYLYEMKVNGFTERKTMIVK